jgi:ABC-type antimicrobial peptide transport system permease subunit
LALRIPVSVNPTGVVIHDGHPYSMPPDAIGLPGTLYLYRDRVRIIAGHVQAVAATVPITQASTLAARIDRALIKERLMTRILTAFAALALLLAAIGLYGVLGYAVTQRTNEIGVRLALGAPRGTVFWSVLRESGTLVVIGVAIGVPSALALTRLLSSFLFGVTPTDPAALSSATACLIVVAIVAASHPAWRALKLDPLVALRYE